MRYLHTMLRVRNLDTAMKFYRDAMGLKEVRRIDNEKGRFTLVFLCAAEDEGLFANLETRAAEEDWRTYTDSSGRDVRVSKTQAYDHVAQILHWTTYRRWREGDQEHTKVTRIALRYTFPQELAALLYYNGFSIVRQYGDWNLEPLTAASPSIIIVCRKHA